MSIAEPDHNTSTIDIRTDELTRRLYANDASMYETLPEAVAFPKSGEELSQLVRHCAELHTTITARSGGTSLAGQTTGSGWIMDVSRYMTGIGEINPDTKQVTVAPGVIRDILNRRCAEYGLQFGPDTSTTNRCMIGGMIGNNSCGLYSIKYRTTREHIHSVDAVLSDGSRVTFGPLTADELEQKKSLQTLEGHIYRGMIRLLEQNRELITSSYPHPDIMRRNTGYALDRLLEMAPFTEGGRPFNLAELLCGSEGTLAMTAEATLNLVPIDPHSIMVVPQFRSLRDAMLATVEAVKMDPAAVELSDRYILEATKGNIEQRRNRFFLEDDPEALLMIQFDGATTEEVHEKAEALIDRLKSAGLGYAFPVLDQPEKMKRAWDLRKAGLGLLMGLTRDSKTPTFVEDTAVRVADLPDYVEDFQELLDRYDTRCVFYAHASVGELHLRPVLDLRRPEDVEKMKAMASDVADLVGNYRGSLSGEHGDGRARSPYIAQVLGSEMMPVLRRVKELWDPNYLFNPGIIVDAQPIDEELRYHPDTPRLELKTTFAWSKEDGFASALELCNGAGVCRKLQESGGTMCPSYMATREEKDSTRGRANIFRQLFFDRLEAAFTSPEIKEALDLCISCKACKSECPASVDMAKMKAEFSHRWHQKNGASMGERFFGHPDRLYPLAARFPKLTNALNRTAPVKWLMDKVMGIAPERELPAFASTPFTKQYQRQEAQLPLSAPNGELLLFVDIFTNFHHPESAAAAVQLFRRLGYRVVVPGWFATGRPQLSKGFLSDFTKRYRETLSHLKPFVEQGTPIVGLEPSELLTLRDEYTDIDPDDQALTEQLADSSYLLEEFLNRHFEQHPDDRQLFKGDGRTIYLHGHCHTKALAGNRPMRECLEAIGARVIDLQTGCCGMAGSFGYERDHYDVSMQIGELKLFPEVRKLDERATVCAPGFSCRHQIADGTERKGEHPAEILVGMLVSGQ